MPDVLDICLYSPGMAHDGATLRAKSLGGSESSAVHAAKALAKRGHAVTVLAPCGGGLWDGVTYVPIEQAPVYFAANPHDVTIVSRQFQAFGMPINSRLTVLWCHDLTRKLFRAPLGSMCWTIDRLYVLSDFQRRQYKEVHGAGLPDDLLFTTRNGLDLSAFAGLAKTPKDRTKLVYGSRPERGLETALQIMDRLRRMGSDLVLHFCTYDNVVPEMRPYYEALWQRAAQMPNVRNLGCLKQADWHREIASSLALIYPGVNGDFSEIHCVVGHEAQACGVPVVSLAKGAMPEAVGDAGVLLGTQDTDVSSEAYQEQFARALVDLQANPADSARLSKRGVQRSREWDWSDVVRAWEGDWETHFARHRDEPQRMLIHAQRTGDVELGRYLAETEA